MTRLRPDDLGSAIDGNPSSPPGAKGKKPAAPRTKSALFAGFRRSESEFFAVALLAGTVTSRYPVTRPSRPSRLKRTMVRVCGGASSNSSVYLTGVSHRCWKVLSHEVLKEVGGVRNSCSREDFKDDADVLTRLRGATWSRSISGRDVSEAKLRSFSTAVSVSGAVSVAALMLLSAVVVLLKIYVRCVRMRSSILMSGDLPDHVHPVSVLQVALD